MGFDPGVVNHAYAVLDDREPVATGMLQYPLQSVADDARFINEYIELLHKYKPQVVVCERYTFRGRQSVYAELVNLMIGKMSIIIMQELGIPLVLIQSAQWKNFYKVKKLPKVKGVKKGSWGIFPNHQKFFKVVHQVDAASMCLWYVDNLERGKK